MFEKFGFSGGEMIFGFSCVVVEFEVEYGWMKGVVEYVVGIEFVLGIV